MDFFEKIMREIIDEASKDIPADVLQDLKELSRLQVDVQMCMRRNRIIDLGKVKRINELTRKHYYHGETHEQTTDTAEPDTFDFGEAIRRVKAGASMARNGWNGKGQYIVLGRNISYDTEIADGEWEAHHKDIGSKAIVFVGTRGTQVGWLASQADMLADDWYEV